MFLISINTAHVDVPPVQLQRGNRMSAVQAQRPMGARGECQQAARCSISAC